MSYGRDIPWNLTRTVAPVIPVIPVAELKDHLRITISDDDQLVEDLGKAAEEAVENELSRALLTQTWVLRLDCFPCWEIRLPRPMLQSVTQVQYLDADGALQTLSTSIYTVDTFCFPGRIHLAYNQVWPTTRAVPNAVLVTYKAGKDAVEDVPELVRVAIKQTCGDLYENRERSAAEVVKQLEIYERLMANYRCVTEFSYR